jgi:DNA-binding NtrC family response regulator
VKHFLKKYDQEMSRSVTGISAEALMLLERYAWPGNIRELENYIERALIYTTGDILEADQIQIPGLREDRKEDPGALCCTLREAREHAEKLAIQRMLEVCGGNKKEAAERLEIDRSILYDKIKRYGL